MSAAAFGKAIGPIAKKIGGEVAEGLSKTADDWGWKGGKKGEITGGEFIRKATENDFIKFVSNTPKFERGLQKQKKLFNNFAKQQELPWVFSTYGDLNPEIWRRANQFKALEDADVPRRWTGKLREAIVKNDPSDWGNPYARIGNEAVYFKTISKAMEGMTESQRETFVTLIPGWADTFEKIIEVSRSL